MAEDEASTIAFLVKAFRVRFNQIDSILISLKGEDALINENEDTD